MVTAVAKYCSRLLFMQCDSSFPTLSVNFNFLIFVFIPILATIHHDPWKVGPCHHGMERPEVVDTEMAPTWTVAGSILNK
jgi:hypothetical protein